MLLLKQDIIKKKQVIEKEINFPKAMKKIWK